MNPTGRLVATWLFALCGCGRDNTVKMNPHNPSAEKLGHWESDKTAGSPQGSATVDAKKISEQVDVLTANLFHDHLSTIGNHVGLRVSYRGPLARTKGLTGFVPIESAETFLEWTVGRGIDHTEVSTHLFTISLSTVKTKGCVAQCAVNGKILYLEAKDLPEGSTLDDPIRGLPGDDKITPRSLLLELANPTGALIMAERIKG